MSLVISTTRAAAMALAGTENNPIMTYQNLVALSGTTITSNRPVKADGALANAADPGTYNFWRPTTDSGTTATFEINRAAAFGSSFMGIAAHNLGSSGATVQPQYSTDGGTTWLNLGVSVAPTTNENIGFYFDFTTAADWRLLISNYTLNFDLRVGVILLSTILTLPTRVYRGYTPPLQATRVELGSNVTDGGNYVRSAVVRKGMATEISADLLPDTFIRGAQFQVWQERFNDGLPFFWAWRPTKYNDLLYAWRNGSEVVPTNSGPKALMSFTASVGAYDDKS